MARHRPFRIGLFGVAGFNRGDEAISKSLVAELSQRRPDLQFIVPVLRPGNFDKFPNVRTFILDRRSPRGLLRLARQVWSSDMVLLGGGSIIQDQFNGSRTRGILGYAWCVSWLAARFGKPLHTAPIGIDELHTDDGRCAARETLRRLDSVTVRDARSAELGREFLSAAPGMAPEIHVASDPAFLFETQAIAPAGGRSLLLAPAFEGRREERICELFAAVCRTILERDGTARVGIIAMEEREHEDAGKIELIVAALPEAMRGRVDRHHPATAEEAAQILRASAGVIAMRLHALILAYGRVPLFCISRGTKTDAMMQSFRIPGARLDDTRPADDIAAQAFEVMQQAGVPPEQVERQSHSVKALRAYYDRMVQEIDAIARS